MWWVGDWLNYGEARYGEMYSQAIEITGYASQTLADAKWVASRIEPSRRHENSLLDAIGSSTDRK